MMSDLTLSGAIPGLLRAGSPCVYLHHKAESDWPNDEDRHVCYLVSGGNAWAGDSKGGWYCGPIAGLALDLSDITARFHCILYLREQGHDLRWAEEEAEVLAWSVLSVSRGGSPIRWVAPVWKSRDPGYFMSAGLYVSYHSQRTADIECVNIEGRWKWRANQNFHDMSDAADLAATQAAADAFALRDRCALRNEDGTLTLPELP